MWNPKSQKQKSQKCQGPTLSFSLAKSAYLLKTTQLSCCDFCTRIL